MAEDERFMKFNSMERKFVQKAIATVAAAKDATRGKQIPFRLNRKFARLTDDDLPVVEGEDDELVGWPQKKPPVGQTKGELYVS